MTRAFAHRRQFVISDRPVALHDGFIYQTLRPGLCLSWCPHLPMVAAQSRDGVAVHLLGTALATDGDLRTPAQRIAATDSDGLAELLWSWAGRWVLVWGDRLYPDAGALLGVHHGRTESGGALVSSSPAFFAQRFPRRHPDPYEPQLGGPVAPGTALAGVRKLLPSFSLSLVDGRVEPVPPMPAGGSGIRPTVGDTVEAVGSMLGNALADATRQNGPASIGLSAGYDSRLLLALAAAHGAGVSGVTFLKDVRVFSPPGAPLPSFSWHHDRTLPAVLAKMVGMPHRFLGPGPVDRAALRAFDEHTGGGFSDNERYYAGRGHTARLDSPVVLKGHGLEVAGTEYLDWLPWSDGQDRDAWVNRLMPYLVDRNGASSRALRGWVADLPGGLYPEGADLKELFYVEQKRAAWLSNVYQGSDFSYDAVAPATCRRVFHALLSLPRAERAGHAVHRALILRHAPALADVPFNPRGGVLERLHRAVYQLRVLNVDLPRKLMWKLHARRRAY